VRVLRAIARFLREDHGQDLADYCLLIALVSLIGLGIFVHISGGIQNIWNVGNSTLQSGQSVAGSSGATGGAHGSGDHGSGDHR
jgi:Flp pilus assembly pilin Flp